MSLKHRKRQIFKRLVMANDTHTWRHNIILLTHNSGLMRTFLCPHNIHPLNRNPLTLRSGRKNSVQSICDITNWTNSRARDDLKPVKEDKHRPALSGLVTRFWTLNKTCRPTNQASKRSEETALWPQGCLGILGTRSLLTPSACCRYGRLHLSPQRAHSTLLVSRWRVSDVSEMISPSWESFHRHRGRLGFGWEMVFIKDNVISLGSTTALTILRQVWRECAFIISVSA